MIYAILKVLLRVNKLRRVYHTDPVMILRKGFYNGIDLLINLRKTGKLLIAALIILLTSKSEDHHRIALNIIINIIKIPQ